MINCHNGLCSIDGSAFDIAMNYLQITDQLLSLAPEIVIETWHQRNEILCDKVRNSDDNMLIILSKCMSTIEYKEDKS